MRTATYIIVLLLVGLAAAVESEALPSFEDVHASFAASDSVLLDRHGAVIHELRTDLHGRRLQWVRLGDTSPAFVKAVLWSEDRRFYEHGGVDWTAALSAAIENLFSDRRRGASTITMQLASIVDPRLRPATGRRTIALKWKQMTAARDLERSWSKERILEAYINLVSYRGELQGISAASRGIFGKNPGGLDEAEAAVLAALIRSPNAPPERVGERAARLAGSMGSVIAGDEVARLARERLARPYSIRKRIGLAPHAAAMLLQPGARRVRSTLDGRIQRFASGALAQALDSLSGQNVRDGAVLVVENATGDVLAYVGNRGSLSSAPFVDGIRARRQAGSTLKPFLYALVIEKRLLTAASLIDDAPLDLPTGRGIYHPANYDKVFRGLVTVRAALASSMNIPAVRTLALAGGEPFVRTLRSFGFTGLADAAHYGPSLALGSADITLWDLVNAYRALANGGRWNPLRLAPEEKNGPPQRVLSRGTAFIISDILSDRVARSATFSLESPLATRFWTAVKTGTSKDMRDNWCVGYSDRYTVGVWIGNFSGESMWDVSGMSGAAPVWLEIMTMLHRSAVSRPPDPPEGLLSRTVVFGDDDIQKKEWFLPGTERERIEAAQRPFAPGILYPVQNMVIALDPDIPPDRQRVFFSATAAGAWVLDGRTIAEAHTVSWTPSAGRHRLTIVDGEGNVADEIGFEVR